MSKIGKEGGDEGGAQTIFAFQVIFLLPLLLLLLLRERAKEEEKEEEEEKKEGEEEEEEEGRTIGGELEEQREHELMYQNDLIRICI